MSRVFHYNSINPKSQHGAFIITLGALESGSADPCVWDLLDSQKNLILWYSKLNTVYNYELFVPLFRLQKMDWIWPYTSTKPVLSAAKCEHFLTTMGFRMKLWRWTRSWGRRSSGQPTEKFPSWWWMRMWSVTTPSWGLCGRQFVTFSGIINSSLSSVIYRIFFLLLSPHSNWMTPLLSSAASGLT